MIKISQIRTWTNHNALILPLDFASSEPLSKPTVIEMLRAYNAGKLINVKKVATDRPPMIAIAIGPQKTLRVNGIIAKIAVAAVKMTGRARRTEDSITASHSLNPFAIS